MAAIALLHAKTNNANRLADSENLYIPGIKGIMKKKIKLKKKFSRQVAVILIIRGKLKI